MRRVEPGRVAALLAIAAAIGAGLFFLAGRGAGPPPPAPPGWEPGGSGPSAPRAPTPVLPEGGASAGSSAPAPEATGGGFLVHVRSAGRAAPAAEVRLYRRGSAPGERWEPAGTARSNADGTTFLAAAPGPHLLAASAPGLARAIQEAVRPAGEDRTVVVLELAASLELAGRTVGRRGGEPVPFADVTVLPVRRGPGIRRLDLPAGERAAATSDERGRFRIAGLAPGRVEVEARAVGHAPARIHDVALPRAAEVVLELVDAGMVEGIVIRDGRPVPGARVSVIGAGEPAQVDTGPGGGFAVEVEPGLHRVFARLGSESGSAGRAIPVAAGSTTRGVEIKLGPSASIAGRVRSGTGPARGASVVALLHGDAASAARASAGADGAYELKGLVPGAYGVSVSAPGHATAIIPGVNLRPGDRFVLDVSLLPPSAVEGTVTDLDGRPVSGALVVADGQWLRGGALAGAGAPPAATVAARTDAAGRYRLEGVSPGQVRVSARRDPASPATVRMLTVEEGETADADLVLVEGGVIAGAVVDAAGSPVPGARVWTSGGGGPPRPGEVRQVDADAGGSFLLALPPGTYALNAARARGAPRFTGRPVPLATVELAAGQRAEVSLSLPEDPPATLAGRVLEPGAAPASGAVVWIGAPGAGLQVTQADADGAFSLAPGTSGPIQVNARNGGRTGVAGLTPPAGDAVIQLKPAAVVQGRLLGDPAPETFSVVLSQRAFLAGGAIPEQQFSEAHFELDDVAPGQVSLHVKTSDGRVGDAQVAASSGETASVDVPLSPACTLTGRLVDAATGKPVTRARVLVDGVASRRYGVGASGQFTRITSEGDHQVTVAAPGYAPLTLKVQAHAGAPADLGDVPMTPSATTPASRP